VNVLTVRTYLSSRYVVSWMGMWEFLDRRSSLSRSSCPDAHCRLCHLCARAGHHLLVAEYRSSLAHRSSLWTCHEHHPMRSANHGALKVRRHNYLYYWARLYPVFLNACYRLCHTWKTAHCLSDVPQDAVELRARVVPLHIYARNCNPCDRIFRHPRTFCNTLSCLS